VRFDTHQLVLNYHLILSGLKITCLISLISLGFGVVLGLVLCLGKLRDKGIIYRVCCGIIDFFRTIPEVVLIFWVYSCLPLLLSFRISAEASGVLALSLFAAAYLAEIFRAGVLSVPRGQVEASLSLGIPEFYIWCRIIFPPALRNMMPAIVNFLTELIKATSLLSAIGIAEMSYQATILGNKTFAYVEFLSAIAVLYFLIIFPLSLSARTMEKRRLASAGN
jgi:His/Glu/Gln/Arg/opine family amino acid ABC transporter permease subunit